MPPRSAQIAGTSALLIHIVSARRISRRTNRTKTLLSGPLTSTHSRVDTREKTLASSVRTSGRQSAISVRLVLHCRIERAQVTTDVVESDVASGGGTVFDDKMHAEFLRNAQVDRRRMPTRSLRSRYGERRLFEAVFHTVRIERKSHGRFTRLVVHVIEKRDLTRGRIDARRIRSFEYGTIVGTSFRTVDEDVTAESVLVRVIERRPSSRVHRSAASHLPI